MKKHKNSRKLLPAHRRSAQYVALKRRVRRERPIHKRLALHPINILAVLCIGVLLIALTIQAIADSYVVTAVVPAPPLTSPAIITSPANNTQLQTQSITVSGTCPSNSYVNLNDNSNFMGTSACSSGSFQVSLVLSQGTNQLVAQDYNVTNQPGPTSSPVSITYSPPSPVTTPAIQPTPVPTTLETLQLDNTIPFTQAQIPIVSDQPTFSGIAPPYSSITVVVHSADFTCTTTANAVGYWSCTMRDILPANLHTVIVTARTLSNQILTMQFTIRAVEAMPPPPPTTNMPFRILSSYIYAVYNVGQTTNYTLALQGGNPPYAVTVDWGDSSTSTYQKLSAGPVGIQHIYKWIKTALGVDTIKIQAMDATGNVTTLQFIAILRNPACGSPSSTSNDFSGKAPASSLNSTQRRLGCQGTVATASSGGGIGKAFGALRSWLWFIWPGYVVVVLLVFSFWLGERQEFLQLASKARLKRHHTLRHRQV
ncbi:MAG TPA: hypothetical protein VGS08_04300 [Candidatus Saccharimonadales bacterium]|nr:hypothetical protein [Candidatus Saccharimonadales bacterium]